MFYCDYNKLGRVWAQKWAEYDIEMGLRYNKPTNVALESRQALSAHHSFLLVVWFAEKMREGISHYKLKESEARVVSFR